MPAVALATGITMYYEESGRGEALVLIMGTGADHTLWAPQVEAYAAHYRTIAVDNRGIGASSMPADPAFYTPRIMADDVAALLDALGIARAHISGLSLGSVIAQELAIHYPDRVLSVELHGTWGRTTPWFQYAIESLRYPLRLGDWQGYARTAVSWVLSPTFVNDAAGCGPVLEAVAEAAATHRDGILGQIQADVAHDTLDRLGQIRAPVLITAGELDYIVPMAMGREVAARLPRAQFHLFRGPRSSHVSSLEMAAEFNALTLDFLSSVRR